MIHLKLYYAFAPHPYRGWFLHRPLYREWLLYHPHIMGGASTTPRYGVWGDTQPPKSWPKIINSNNKKSFYLFILKIENIKIKFKNIPPHQNKGGC